MIAFVNPNRINVRANVLQTANASQLNFEYQSEHDKSSKERGLRI